MAVELLGLAVVMLVAPIGIGICLYYSWKVSG